MIGFSVAAQRLHVERYGVPCVNSQESEYERIPTTLPVSVTTSPATAARRRHVMTVLVGATVLFVLVGIIPGARMMWDLALLSLGCTAAYVALLIHFHRLAVERAQKVIALETRRHATEVLESRRHVIAVDRAQQAAGGGYGAGRYGGVVPSYASAGPALSGSGWSVMGVQAHRSAAR
jgi:hypothetical protein